MLNRERTWNHLEDAQLGKSSAHVERNQLECLLAFVGTVRPRPAKGGIIILVETTIALYVMMRHNNIKYST